MPGGSQGSLTLSSLRKSSKSTFDSRDAMNAEKASNAESLHCKSPSCSQAARILNRGLRGLLGFPLSVASVRSVVNPAFGCGFARAGSICGSRLPLLK